MGKTIIGVRDVDEEVYRKFRARAVRERIALGAALTRAMKKALEEKMEEKKDIKNLLKIRGIIKVKPFDWGKGSEKTSTEVDKILYG